MNIEEIYTVHAEKVYNIALQYTQNTEDAKEVLQNVFISIYQNIEKFRGEAKISTWIYRIAINKSLDFVKSKNFKNNRNTFSIFKENDGIAEIPHFNHPGVELEQKQSLIQLFDAINELPENQKTALILHKIEKLSQIEVGEIMKLSPKAVESLVHRAKQSLWKKLQNLKGN